MPDCPRKASEFQARDQALVCRDDGTAEEDGQGHVQALVDRAVRLQRQLDGAFDQCVEGMISSGTVQKACRIDRTSASVSSPRRMLLPERVAELGQQRLRSVQLVTLIQQCDGGPGRDTPVVSGLTIRVTPERVAELRARIVAWLEEVCEEEREESGVEYEGLVMFFPTDLRGPENDRAESGEA